jgi:hypothetical protein
MLNTRIFALKTKDIMWDSMTTFPQGWSDMGGPKARMPPLRLGGIYARGKFKSSPYIGVTLEL